ncbi:hypothetical protein RJ53_08960 [Methanocalculus chunghsingensis]|uniref:Uncharacterized protein n=1 Tax=Methanocalculus chunghsingensis TaxID=156457 RepID=A0A8J7WB00_9EURY|nr:hypothetical protein [Methanocalculus chunghsingensis]MBR1369605.1 hypothetical protein [Methanocalculus chunghsingensis]
MFSKLRSLLGRKEEKPETLVLGSSDLPGWLDRKEEEYQAELASRLEAPQSEIAIALKKIRELIVAIDHDPESDELHPKVKSVLKTARPQAIRSLTLILEKEPAGPPREYYGTAAEILKGCITVAKGPGKYLAAAYNEEMAEFRRTIKEIGRAVNDMTEAISEDDARQARIRDIRAMHNMALEMIRTHEQALQTIRSAEEEVDHLDRTKTELLAAIEAVDTGDATERIDAAVAEREAAIRHLAQIRSPAGSVLGRAEKLLKRHKAPVGDIQELQRICREDHPRPEALELIPPVISSIRSLIQSGELQLKNREEQQLFSGVHFAESMKKVYEEYRAAEEKLATVRQEVASHPGIQEEIRLNRERTVAIGKQDTLKKDSAKAEEERLRIEEEYPRTCATLIDRLHQIDPTVDPDLPHL